MTKYIIIMFCLFNTAKAQKAIPGVIASSIQISTSDSFDYKYGWINLVTSGVESDSAKWSNIKIAVQAAIEAHAYSTTRTKSNEDIIVSFAQPGYWVRFVVYPLDAPIFSKWSEVSNPLQQDIIMSDGGMSGAFSRGTIAAGRIISTRYQTSFTHSIKFSR